MNGSKLLKIYRQIQVKEAIRRKKLFRELSPIKARKKQSKWLT